MPSYYRWQTIKSQEEPGPWPHHGASVPTPAYLPSDLEERNTFLLAEPLKWGFLLHATKSRPYLPWCQTTLWSVTNTIMCCQRVKRCMRIKTPSIGGVIFSGGGETKRADWSGEQGGGLNGRRCEAFQSSSRVRRITLVGCHQKWAQNGLNSWWLGLYPKDWVHMTWVGLRFLYFETAS